MFVRALLKRFHKSKRALIELECLRKGIRRKSSGNNVGGQRWYTSSGQGNQASDKRIHKLKNTQEIHQSIQQSRVTMCTNVSSRLNDFPKTDGN